MFFGRKKKQKLDPRRPKGVSMENIQAPSDRIVRKVPELRVEYRRVAGNRKYQQDDLYVSAKCKKLAFNKKTRVMAVVCDGMGGMADGGRASSTAIKMMAQAFQKVEREPELDIPRFFQQGIYAIDRTIAGFPKEDGKGSGTTMAACIAEDNRLYWASVGDSRIYIIRGTQIQQVTKDHNYGLRLEQMKAAGRITEEEVTAARHKEALISFLGMGNVSLMDINTAPFEMQFGDVIMICSDGITKTLPDAQIRKIITAEEVKLEKKAEALITAATRMNTHSQDNTSVVLICYREKDIRENS